MGAAVVVLTRKMFLYLDSLHGKDELGAIPTLKKWLVHEAKDKKSNLKAKSLKLRSWKCHVNKYRVMRKEGLPSSFSGFDAVNGDIVEIHSQDDDSSCGVFVTKRVECLSVGKPLCFTQTDIARLRQRVAIDLYRSFIPL